MKKILMPFFICLATISFLCNGIVTAEEPKIDYKYQYNDIPIKQPVVTNSMKAGIAEYNRGNYLGAMQEFYKVVNKEPKNSYAIYYLGLSLSKLGYESEANACFQIVADRQDNYALALYAQRGLNCIGNSDNDICKNPPKNRAPRKEITGAKQAEEMEQLSDIAKFIESGQKMHPSAKDRIEKERMVRKIQDEQFKLKGSNGEGSTVDAGASESEDVDDE